MCANTSGEVMWTESSRRFRSFQAGSTLWKTPGVSWAPYQPTPKPSPFVSSAPICEWRLWTISEFFWPYRSSSSRTGEPEYASQRHIDQILAALRKGRVIPIGRCSVSRRAERLQATNSPRRRVQVLASSYPFLDVVWTMFIFFAFVIWIWLLIMILADNFARQDHSGWAKAGWTLFVIFTPLLGVLVYMIVRPPLEKTLTARSAN